MTTKIAVTCKVCALVFMVHACRKDSALFCSRKCKGIARKTATVVKVKPCLVCGKPIQFTESGKNRKYCSFACFGKAREKKVLWVCQKCGVQRITKPSLAKATFCSKCDDHINDPSFIKKMVEATSKPESRKRQIESMLENNKTNPRTGKFDTNASATEWHLRSPDGVEFHFRNLRHFIRTHRFIFTEAQLKLEPSCRHSDPRTQIEKRLGRLNPMNKHPQTTAQGWTWIMFCESQQRQYYT